MRTSRASLSLKSLASVWFDRPRPARTRVRPTFRPCLEELEDRLTPNAYVVNLATDTSGSNTGTGSGLTGDLRYVLNHAIVDGQADTITFDPTVFGTAQTITLNASLDTDPTHRGGVQPDGVRDRRHGQHHHHRPGGRA